VDGAGLQINVWFRTGALGEHWTGDSAGTKLVNVTW